MTRARIRHWCIKRRNLVLQEMVGLNVITQAQFTLARRKPLGVILRPPTGTSPYPAFLQYVHRQLERDYREEDLRSEGLRIFTTLDPRIQHQAEVALTSRLGESKRRAGSPPIRWKVPWW